MQRVATFYLVYDGAAMADRKSTRLNSSHPQHSFPTRRSSDLATGKLRNSQAMLVPAVYNGKPLSNPAEIQSDTINAAEMENNNNINQANESEPSHSRAIIHQVKSGDTLQNLAAKYNTNTKTLMKINHLKNAKLKAGQKLKINEAIANNNNSKNNGLVKASYKRNKGASASRQKSKSSHTYSKINGRKNSSAKHVSARAHHRLK